MKTTCSWHPEKCFPRPHLKPLRKLIKRAAELSCANLDAGHVSVSFLSSRKMTEVNQAFLGHSGDTDVICFDYRDSLELPEGESAGEDAVTLSESFDEPDAGDALESQVDLLICPRVAFREAKKRNLPYEKELTLYLIHGLLHAAGYDDLQPVKKRRMRRAESRVMKQLLDEFSLEEVFPGPTEEYENE